MIPYDLPPYFMLSWMFLYGAVIGSFLTVCVHRLPMYAGVRAGLLSLVKSASHCDHCHQHLLARDNIPIFGWLLLGGRCRFCKTGIPVKYPLIELANGLLFVFVYAMEVPLNHWNPLADSCLNTAWSTSSFENAWGLSSLAMVNGRCFYHLILVEVLMVAALIAWDTRSIPRSVTVPAMITGVLGGTAFGYFWIVPVAFHSAGEAPGLQQLSLSSFPTWIGMHPHWHGLAVSLTGLVTGGGLMWCIQKLTRYFLDQQVFAAGEVMLMAAVGSFVGWQPVIVICWTATLLIVATILLSTFRIIAREIPATLLFSLATGGVLLGWRWIWPGVAWNFSSLPVLLLSTALLLTTLPAALFRMATVRPLTGPSIEVPAQSHLPSLRIYSGE